MLAKIGKFVVVVKVTLALTQDASDRSLDWSTKFVRASSSNKPLGVRVTGSWSNRGVFAWTTSMRPWKLTMVAMEFRTNEGIRKMIGAGVMNGILLDMAVVGAMAGAAMCDGLTAKSCLGLDRLTSPPGKGTEKLAGVPASLPIRNLNMVTYLPCKNTR
jgi:hypothetical protein